MGKSGAQFNVIAEIQRLKQANSELRQLSEEKELEIQAALCSIDQLTTRMTNTVTAKMYYVLERIQKNLMRRTFHKISTYNKQNISFDQFI